MPPSMFFKTPTFHHLLQKSSRLEDGPENASEQVSSAGRGRSGAKPCGEYHDHVELTVCPCLFAFASCYPCPSEALVACLSYFFSVPFATLSSPSARLSRSLCVVSRSCQHRSVSQPGAPAAIVESRNERRAYARFCRLPAPASCGFSPTHAARFTLVICSPN